MIGFSALSFFRTRPRPLSLRGGGARPSVPPPAPIIDLTKFCSPNELGNVNLVFGDKKLRVSKEYLAVHSPVFAAMFYGDFAEKGKEEVEIKDVNYEEFIDLLQFIFLRSLVISDRYVPCLLMLGDRFQMEVNVRMF
ncbi:hypothetical protein PMAYCL1PPCAC_25423, partial [Pristionchus mayeri]